jgi:hypothetical protein
MGSTFMGGTSVKIFAVAMCVTTLAFAFGSIRAQDDTAMLPIVTETIAPIEHFVPVSRDGHKGEA